MCGGIIEVDTKSANYPRALCEMGPERDRDEGGCDKCLAVICRESHKKRGECETISKLQWVKNSGDKWRLENATMKSCS